MQINEYNLADISEGLLDKILEWRNSDKIRKMMFSDNEITLKEHLYWYESIKAAKDIKVKVLLYLNNPVGLVKFDRINELHGTCYWGFYIGEDSVPKGTGTVLGYLGLNYIFNNKGMRKVCSEIIEFNYKSIEFHRKLGFYNEGRQLKQIKKQNQYHDVIQMGYFKESWIKNREFLIERIRGY